MGCILFFRTNRHKDTWQDPPSLKMERTWSLAFWFKHYQPPPFPQQLQAQAACAPHCGTGVCVESETGLLLQGREQEASPT